MYRIAEFDNMDDAEAFRRLKGKEEYSICAGTTLHWAVIPRPVRAVTYGSEEPAEYVTTQYADPDEFYDSEVM
jgi:hypothetical protein